MRYDEHAYTLWGGKGKQNPRHGVNWLPLHLHMSERAMIFISFVIFLSMQRDYYEGGRHVVM